ncbi:MAG: chlorohydrolase, partial [Spirochaetaceae bacterium]
MILIKNATALEFDPPRIREAVDILIEGRVITAVGPEAEKKAAGDAKRIDAGGRLVYPGIVDSHHHYYSGLARGILAEIGPTPDFISVLKNLWWRLDRANTEQSLYYAGLVCNLDAIRAGTTTVIDHSATPAFIGGSLDALKRSFEEVGIRGATCYEVTDRHGKADMIAGVEENVAFATQIERERADGS